MGGTRALQSQPRTGWTLLQVSTFGKDEDPFVTQLDPHCVAVVDVHPRQSAMVIEPLIETVPDETQPVAVGMPSCDVRTSSSAVHMCAVAELLHDETASQSFFA